MTGYYLRVHHAALSYKNHWLWNSAAEQKQGPRGPSHGPGHSLLKCFSNLSTPFFFYMFFFLVPFSSLFPDFFFSFFEENLSLGHSPA